MSMDSDTERGVFRSVLRASYSLKLAVLVMGALALALAVGTVIESRYDTQTAQYYVYRAEWFRWLMGALGVNILAVMLSRLPWRRRHAPFLLAHLGILVLLLGSWLTDRRGLDGHIRVSEGETASAVEVNAPMLAVTEAGRVHFMEVPWRPPGAAFKPLALPKLGLGHDLEIKSYLSHAERVLSFAPAATASGQGARPAVRLRISGGPMRISRELWLWAGEPAWSQVQAGPALLALGAAPAAARPQAQAGAPMLWITPNPKGGLSYEALSSNGQSIRGRLAPAKLADQTIDPDWKGVRLTFLEWLPDALPQVSYKASDEDYGDTAPPSAILLASKGGSAEVWLGLGERTVLRNGTRSIEIGYFNQRTPLPFSLKLERFDVDHYNGSSRPSSFSSRVAVQGAGGASSASTISMNEPLKREDVTIYQSSYEERAPRPITSILSVNRDPGRPWKYAGSLLLVLGSILLFVSKSVKKRKQGAPCLPRRSSEAFV